MIKSIQWRWPIAGIVAIVWAGCGSPPETDETDPLPTVFENKTIEPTKFGQGSGTGMGGGTRGRIMAEPGGADRKDAEKSTAEPPSAADDKPDNSKATDPKKGDDPTAAPDDSSKQEKKDGPDKEQP